MQGPLRGILAGVAAWKWGGGCLSMILILAGLLVVRPCEVLS